MDGNEVDVPEFVVDALSDQQRRAIVSHLASREEPASLTELADHLTSDDAGAAGPPRSSPPSKKLLVKLHHVQLPKLDDAGLVEYAPEKRRVAYAGEWVLPDVDDVEEVEDTTSALAASLH